MECTVYFVALSLYVLLGLVCVVELCACECNLAQTAIGGATVLLLGAKS